ncbi:hypothetical protein JX265_014071 [Neoarthrinium moseri]|uniref:Uncharacterized protein n=1 Tax=Neoarthrinium moseri TaxID=1658444 RepID=A0A9Q0AH16_9PEZI|nr:hypothetical protein JX265_014071 [Neoarthrinium moseri]
MAHDHANNFRKRRCYDYHAGSYSDALSQPDPSLTLAPMRSAIPAATPCGAPGMLPPNPEPVNYLATAHSGQLHLIDGTTDTIPNLLHVLQQYHDIVNRNESFASGLGAKLITPRFMKATESVFEDSIVTIPAQTVNSSNPVTWLDIVEFAKVQLHQTNFFKLADGTQRCKFTLKGVRVEISAADWHLAASDAMSRDPLAHPQLLDRDESTELETLNIVLEQLPHLGVTPAERHHPAPSVAATANPKCES